MKKKIDNVWFGLSLGVLLPALFGILFIASTYHGRLDFGELLSLMSSDSTIIKLLCVAIFPDMCGVFLLNTLEMWRACRGVFAALGLYMLVCCIFLMVNAF